MLNFTAERSCVTSPKGATPAPQSTTKAPGCWLVSPVLASLGPKRQLFTVSRGCHRPRHKLGAGSNGTSSSGVFRGQTILFFLVSRSCPCRAHGYSVWCSFWLLMVNETPWWPPDCQDLCSHMTCPNSPLFLQNKTKLYVSWMVHTLIPSTREAGAGGSL